MFLHPLFILIPQYNLVCNYPYNGLCMSFCMCHYIPYMYLHTAQYIHLYIRYTPYSNRQSSRRNNFRNNYPCM